MANINRVFLIVLDSVGIGEMPDAADYGDLGTNTLRSASRGADFYLPNLRQLGLFNIDGVGVGEPVRDPAASFARLAEASRGKDTTIGHWEIAGIVSEQALPTYPDGFPPEVVQALETACGRRMLCNKPYSGTEVIAEFGQEQVETGSLILYTSADSVLQLAAHEEVVPLEELYRICGQAREIMQGEHGVGRIIARPFVGRAPDFTRTAHRHDYSLLPPGTTMLDVMAEHGLDVIGVGKISDIFAGRGIGESQPIAGNRDGMQKTLALAERDFRGLCFVNLVDFDMLYGHRNDIEGYARALTEFDVQLGELLPRLRPDDLLLITADHGCDPGYTASTDHSREHVPLLVCGEGVRRGVNLGTRASFSDIAATLLDVFGLPIETAGTSFKREVII